MSSPSTWSPTQYERFKAERTQPFFDLLALVKRESVATVVDLGCGTGELTRQLHDTLQAQSTVGVDSSETMLERSALHRTGGLSFERGSIETYAPPQPVDLVFSNAALHWVADHSRLFERLAAMVAPGGQLAVQMPANFDHASHLVSREVAQEPPFAEHVGAGARAGVLAPETYSQLLYENGFSEQHVRLQVYPHVLPNADAVVEWVKGSLLTDFKSRLPPPLYDRFVARYREVLLGRLGTREPFLFTFKRVFLWARR